VENDAGIMYPGMREVSSSFVRPLAQMWNACSLGIPLCAVFLRSLFRQCGRRSKVLDKVKDASVWDFPPERLRVAANGHSFFQENRPAGVGGESACGGQNNVARPVLHLHAPTE
jgi:hypothetical protein